MRDTEGLYKVISPALNADQIDTPLLIQAADNEFRSSLMLYSSMVKESKAVEMIIFTGEGHQPSQPIHKITIGQRNVDWFRFWLQGYEDPSASKVAQYARWHKFRKLRDAEQPAT